MAKVTSEGRVKVRWVPVIASIAAPTVAEITAGTDLTPETPTNGLDISPTQNNASIAMLDSGYVAEQVGTESDSITLTFTRIDVIADDDAWNLFTKNLRGYLLISRFGAPAAGSRVEVYPVEAHTPSMLAAAENEFQQFQVALAVHTEPNRKAVVAA